MAKASAVLLKNVQVGPDIRISEHNHEKLVKHIKEKLEFASQFRDPLVDRFEIIDKEYSGYLIPTDDDRKRIQDNQRGEGLKPVDVKIQLTKIQIDEAVTFLASVLAPDSGMYEVISSPQNQDTIQTLAKRMNYDADKKSYYRHLLNFLHWAMRYNFACLNIEWAEDKGISLTNQAGGELNEQKATLWRGNKLEAVDVYNLLWDVSTSLIDMPTKGEFVATVEMHTEFRVKRMNERGEIFGFDRFKDLTNTEIKYYRKKPDTRPNDSLSGTDNAGPDWVAIFNATPSSGTAVKGYEFVNYYTWLNPTEFGLAPASDKTRNRYEIWQLTMVNNKDIAFAEQLENAHGMLPFVFSMPAEDNCELQAQSYAEILFPFQTYASYLINVAQRADRKRLYGITVFDPDVIPLDEAKLDEAARIKARSTGLNANKKIGDSMVNFSDAPDTKDILQRIDQITQLMQKILPTNINQQLAGLERATQYQAASLVQGANRRNHKIAKLINEQALNPSRSMIVSNILQYGQVEKFQFRGEQVEFDPAKIRALQAEFDIGEGLKGIDRLTVVEGLKEILQFMFQTPDAWKRSDVLAFANYWTTLLGDKFDLTSFKFEGPLDGMAPEEQQQLLDAFEKLKAEAGTQEENQ